MKSLIRKEIVAANDTYESRTFILGVLVFSRTVPYELAIRAMAKL